MNRWQTMLTNHWRAKVVSLAVAALLWLAIRHAMPPPRTGAAADSPVSSAERRF